MTKLKFTSSILILSLLVVACGDSNETSSDAVTVDEELVTQTTVESTNEVSEPAAETLTGEILIDGSSTVFPITQAVAEEFTILNPDVKISVGVSGTGGGFKKFCPGETMISNASRAIKDKEVALCEENNTKYLEVQVGIDALSVVIPSSNDWATCLTVDELNSVIGMVLAEFERLEAHHKDGGGRATVRTVRSAAIPKLGLIQQELFDIGGECSFMPGQIPEMMTVISQEQADRLCDEMDVWTEQLEPLSSFILPAGSPLISTIHLARTIARRAERKAVQIRDADGEGAVRDVVIAYLNRMSDWFFVLARWVGMTLGEDETLWVPLGKRMQD